LQGVIRYDENGNPEPIADTFTRAKEIFSVSDHEFVLLNINTPPSHKLKTFLRVFFNVVDQNSQQANINSLKTWINNIGNCVGPK
jgi:hypothetical protein